MKNERFQLLNKVKVFIFFIDDLLINYPRSELVLKDRLISSCYDLLELVYLGNVMEDRLDIQKNIVVKISMIDSYIEFSYKKKCISEKKMNSAARQLSDIRKMTYGWIKANEGKL